MPTPTAVIEGNSPAIVRTRAGVRSEQSIIDLWATDVGKNRACAAAIGHLLLSDPTLVDLSDLPAIADHVHNQSALHDRSGPLAGAWFAAAAYILIAAGRRAQALTLCSGALDVLAAACSDSDISALIEELCDELEPDNGELFAPIHAACRASRHDPADNVGLRSVALEAFLTGRLREAEHIYHLLLSRGFEPGGTRCHLARLLLFQSGRDDEAWNVLAEAWSHHHEEPLYIHVRTLFLQALMTSMRGGDPHGYFSQIKSVIAQCEIYWEWTLAPTLERLGDRVNPAHRQIFTVLLKVLNSTSTVADLDALPAWRQLPTTPIGGNSRA